MSILLEALRHHANNNKASVKTGVPTIVPELVMDHQDSMTSDDTSMESVLAVLDIKKPDNIAWQLTLTHDPVAPVIAVKDEGVLNAPAPFELLSEYDHELQDKGLELIFPEANDDNLSVMSLHEIHQDMPQDMPSIPVSAIDHSPTAAHRYLSMNQQTVDLQSELPTHSVEKAIPKPVNQPLAAQQAPKKLHLRNDHLMRVVAIVVGSSVALAGIGYYAWQTWLDEQTLISSQLAVYKAQPLVNVGTLATTAKEVAPAMVATSATETGLPVPMIDDINTPTVTNKSAKRSMVGVVASSEQHHKEQNKELSISRSLPISALLDTAWTRWQQGDVVGAEQHYRQVLEKQPNHRDALIGMLAVTQLQQQTLPQAYQIADRLQTLYPNDREVNAAIRSIQGYSETKSDQESNLKQALRSDPSNAGLVYQLAILYASGQRWPDAQAQFFKAVSLDPLQPEYIANLAIAYDQLGKGKLAAAAYQRALDIAKTRPTSVNQDAIMTRLQFLLSEQAGE